MTRYLVVFSVTNSELDMSRSSADFAVLSIFLIMLITSLYFSGRTGLGYIKRRKKFNDEKKQNR